MPLPALSHHDAAIAEMLLVQLHIDPNSNDADAELYPAVREYLIQHEHVLPAAAEIRARLAAAIAIRNLGIQPGDPQTHGDVASFAAHVGGEVPFVGKYVGPGAGAAVTTVEDVAHAGEAAAKATISVGEFLGKLADPSTWLRGVYVVGGSLLVLGGVFIIARELGAPGVPSPTKLIPGKRALRRVFVGKKAPAKGGTK
jgi:hypothetical protein